MPIVLSLLCTGAYLHGVGNCPDVEWSSSGARRLVLVQMHHSSTVDQIYYTGMDITCVYTSFYGFICDSVRLLHVTSDVIRTIVVRRRPNRIMTYVIT